MFCPKISSRYCCPTGVRPVPMNWSHDPIANDDAIAAMKTRGVEFLETARRRARQTGSPRAEKYLAEWIETANRTVPLPANSCWKTNKGVDR